MEFQSFLGPKTAATAAGILPLASVFGAVPSPDCFLGRDISPCPAPSQLRLFAAAPSRDDGYASNAVPCGCEA
jgi:hypothetical protein